MDVWSGLGHVQTGRPVTHPYMRKSNSICYSYAGRVRYQLSQLHRSWTASTGLPWYPTHHNQSPQVHPFIPTSGRTAAPLHPTLAPRPRPQKQQAEQQVLGALQGAKGRGKEGLAPEQLEALNAAVGLLEADGGEAAPTTLPQLDGKWRLLYTSRPGSASPIQRTFTGVEAFSIFQVRGDGHGCTAGRRTGPWRIMQGGSDCMEALSNAPPRATGTHRTGGV